MQLLRTFMRVSYSFVEFDAYFKQTLQILKLQIGKVL